MAGQCRKRFGNCGYPAADGLIGVDHISVKQHFEYAVMRFNQLRPHAKRVGHCFRQTGGGFEKASFHTVANINDS